VLVDENFGGGIMAKDEKEEIIELTEVVEEPPTSVEKGDLKVSLSEEQKSPEKEKNLSPGVPPAPEPLKASPDEHESEVRALGETLNAKAERGLASEGIQVLNQGMREMIPRAAADVFGKELEKWKIEVEELRAQKEALKIKIEEWMASEGSRVLEKVAREMFPGIAAEVLRQEIERLRAEAEEKV
jgi:hypothetical protein